MITIIMTPKSRNSKQRELILSIVRGSHTHPSAETIYTEARKNMPVISLGTVYRNLRLLTEMGLIREVHFDSGPNRFDGKLDAHEHFICNSCAKVVDLAPTLAHPQVAGKTVTSYRLDYFGLCEICSQR